MSSPMIVWLNDISQDQFHLVGGKGANLGKLAAWRLPTVEGFVVTTEAYLKFLLSCDLEDKIADILGESERDDIARIHRQSQNIRELITSANLPLDIAQQIRRSYVELGEDPVAVRSSATAEDLPLASFAGQQESYLNVIGPDALLASVRACWASLWTSRAITYRANHNVDNTRIRIAVVVQRMLNPDVSGIMFTTNPLNARTGELVINASYGLGEAIVSGAVTPDTYVLDKKKSLILQSRVETKETMMVSGSEGGVQSVGVSPDRRRQPSLSNEQIVQLARLGISVEQLYSSAQDIEWALSGGRLYLLQARPITGWRLSGPIRKTYGHLQKLFLSLIFDYFPSPPYHFDCSVVLSLAAMPLQLSKKFGMVPPVATQILKMEPDGSLTLVPALPRLSWHVLPGILAGALEVIRTLRVDPSIWVKEQWPKVAAQLEEVEKCDASAASADQLLNTIRMCVSIRDTGIFMSRLSYFYGGWVAMILLPAVLKVIAGREAGALYYGLMSNLDHPTAAMNRQLREMVQLAASLPTVRACLERPITESTWTDLKSSADGRTFLEALDRFITQFGARTGVLIPVPSLPSWEDNPSVVLSLIRAMLSERRVDRDNLLQTPEQRYRESYARTLKLASRFPFGIVGAVSLVQALIEKTRAMLTERDWIIFAYERAARPIRRAMWELGGRLSINGQLGKRSDIRFLTLEEVDSLMTSGLSHPSTDEMRFRIRQRKMARPKTVANWGMPSASTSGHKGGLALEGTPASPGKASGRARIILSEDEFSQLRAGEILVCRSTNPAWTPLFTVASAVVADSGGPLSHAAIVAREYGIPAVLNTKYATAKMESGETYTIDGTEGKVWGTKFREAVED